jgi:hypothetical protein
MNVTRCESLYIEGRDRSCVIISFGTATEVGVRWGDLLRGESGQQPRCKRHWSLQLPSYCRWKHTEVTMHILKGRALGTLNQTARIFISSVLTWTSAASFVLKYANSKHFKPTSCCLIPSTYTLLQLRVRHTLWFLAPDKYTHRVVWRRV